MGTRGNKRRTQHRGHQPGGSKKTSLLRCCKFWRHGVLFFAKAQHKKKQGHVRGEMDGKSSRNSGLVRSATALKLAKFVRCLAPPGPAEGQIWNRRSKEDFFVPMVVLDRVSWKLGGVPKNLNTTNRALKSRKDALNSGNTNFKLGATNVLVSNIGLLKVE